MQTCQEEVRGEGVGPRWELVVGEEGRVSVQLLPAHLYQLLPRYQSYNRQQIIWSHRVPRLDLLHHHHLHHIRHLLCLPRRRLFHLLLAETFRDWRPWFSSLCCSSNSNKFLHSRGSCHQ